MKFSYLVTKYRERISLNKSEFAKKTGLKPGYITNIEKGKEYPSIERVEKMTTIFNLESNEASNFFRVYFSEKYPSRFKINFISRGLKVSVCKIIFPDL